MHKKEHHKHEHHAEHKEHHHKKMGEHHSSHHNMRGFPMPAKEFEVGQGEIGHESNLKYAGQFDNPKELDEMTSGLANYAKSHKMKYY